MIIPDKMKKLFYNSSLAIIFLLISFVLPAQNRIVDSLKKLVQQQQDGVQKINLLNELNFEFLRSEDRKAALSAAEEALAISTKLKYKKGEAESLVKMGEANSYRNYAGPDGLKEAIEQINKGLRIFESLKDKEGIGKCFLAMGNLYRNQPDNNEALKNLLNSLEIFEKTGNKKLASRAHMLIGYTYDYNLINYPEALKHYYSSLRLLEELGNEELMANLYRHIGLIFYKQDNIAEAMTNFDSALKKSERTDNKNGIAYANNNIGDVNLKQGNYEEALKKYQTAISFFIKGGMKGSAAITSWGIGDIYKRKATTAENEAVATGFYKEALTNYQQSIAFAKESNDKGGLGYYYAFAASMFIKLHQTDSAEKYAQLSMQMARELGTVDNFEKSYYARVEIDSARGDFTQAYKNYKTYIIYRDSVINQESSMQSMMHKMQYESEKKQAIAQAESDKKEAQLRRTRNLQYSISGVFLLLAIFLFWNNRQKHKANRKIERAYAKLKSTQAQLVQAEKMASLGELTAGIAHEIQNPLNFVNNFSEVSKELLEEMKDELEKGNTEDAKQIANDLIQNLEKINHHGKRADGIVKGMLQHSRSSSGQKEMTDINALCDEYLRLSYHGLRAKDKSFNAKFETSLDYSIEKINVMPQEIGRVILNLINNAFYAVSEKRKLGIEGYEPTVTVSTKKESRKVIISVKDNGKGIPQNIIDKIFQPFFTTKPTGEGTGLGLSLSYDIITKGHSGELKVETKENEGTTFIIILPS